MTTSRAAMERAPPCRIVTSPAVTSPASPLRISPGRWLSMSAMWTSGSVDAADRLKLIETIVRRDPAGVKDGRGPAPIVGWACMARPRPIDPADHLGRPWGVHALACAEGLALHDIWEVDAALPPETTLAQWVEVLRQERLGTATDLLLAVRWGLGRVLGLDRGRPVFTLSTPRARSNSTASTIGPSRRSCISRSSGDAPGWRSTSGPMGGSADGTCASSTPFRRAIVYPTSWRRVAGRPSGSPADDESRDRSVRDARLRRCRLGQWVEALPPPSVGLPLQRHDQRVLGELLGEPHVTRDPCELWDEFRRFDPPRGVNGCASAREAAMTSDLST
jgi:hypothetical protein